MSFHLVFWSAMNGFLGSLFVKIWESMEDFAREMSCLPKLYKGTTAQQASDMI